MASELPLRGPHDPGSRAGRFHTAREAMPLSGWKDDVVGVVNPDGEHPLMAFVAAPNGTSGGSARHGLFLDIFILRWSDRWSANGRCQDVVRVQ